MFLAVLGNLFLSYIPIPGNLLTLIPVIYQWLLDGLVNGVSSATGCLNKLLALYFDDILSLVIVIKLIIWLAEDTGRAKKNNKKTKHV